MQVTFFFLLVVVSFLIVAGVVMNLYLYRHRALGVVVPVEVRSVTSPLHEVIFQ